MSEPALAYALRRLDRAAREEFHRLLIRDQAERDAVAERLLRRRTPGADQLADLLDHLSLDDDARLRVVRLLGELEAGG